MENKQNNPFNSDTYFLIQKFLSSGLLKKTLKVFNEELEEQKILPPRIDWEGNKHDRTVEDMVGQFPNIRQDYLLHLCHLAMQSFQEREALSKNKSFLSFRPNAYHKNGALTNFRQCYNYVTRIHSAPIQNVNVSFNLVNSLRGREISGPLTRHRTVSPNLFQSMQIQRTTIGHLSAVFCLLFDHSGKYIITGADDLLIKLWSSRTGRLISVFRGASAEITDIAINSENTLLASGSIDRILRVWNLQNGAPVAVLPGHNGMITSISFCPTPCWDIRYLISTSTDGSIAFWPYTYESGIKVEFRNNPIMYQEKIRPGQAQMICSSFSPGGTFLATGSADHHVRVYYMKGDEGPHRILEMEAHSDRVDSIQWAHSGLKFLSGSKDGMAIIWWFEKQQWKSLHLDMTTKLVNSTNVQEVDSKKLKVTMVCWNKSDYWVVTAVSDHTLKIWTADDGQLVKVLTGHVDEIYVLEAHPQDNNVILSAGHDGQLFIWDISKGEIVFNYLNRVDGQGFGAIYDVKWSPDGSVIAASDSHGHILIFGFGNGSPFFQQLPMELFFHTDYRPLVRDTNHHVLDEQTQIPPHLMPPPFLVDIDGNPYPPMLQRLVPGRETCNVDQLVPNIVIGNEGSQEVIQDLPQNHLVAIERNQSEELRENSSFRPGRRSSLRDHERIRHSTGDWQNDPTFKWQKNVLVETLSSAVLERATEIREAMKDAEMEEYQKQLRQRPHMISINISSNIKKKEEKKKKPTKYVTRSAANYGYQEEEIESSANENGYETTSGSSDWLEEQNERPKRSSRRQRSNNACLQESETEQEDEDIDVEVYEDEDYNVSWDYDDSGPSYSRARENSTRKDRESAPAKTKEHKLSKKRRSRPTGSNKMSENSKDSVSSSSRTSRSTTSKNDETPSRHNGSGSAKEINASKRSGSNSYASDLPKTSKITKISEQYRLSEWLSETRPRKSPYYPQLGDEIVYFLQGHQLYLNAVEMKNLYEISTKELPWTKMNIKYHEFAKVIGIQYEIKPPRLCCLKLAFMDDSGRLTGKCFTVKYHDMPDVLDFFVLKQIYVTAMSRTWKTGNKFRCMIGDEWWIGEIINKSPASDTFPDSSFLCYEIKWKNGEKERMSPWDLEPIDPARVPEDEIESIPVLEEELTSILYKTIQCDWPYSNISSMTKNIVTSLTRVMELAIAEPFLVPVDINEYPLYAMVIEYPIDLSTIKARFENRFYRRLIAAQFDIRYLATNAEKFNEKHSNIVKHARILTELCLRILRNCSEYVDVPSMYHRLNGSYDSSESEEEQETLPSTSKNLRTVNKRSVEDSSEWQEEARNLIETLWASEDSVPFRQPVDPTVYPDYHEIVENPMDLGTVKEKLNNNKYRLPQQFCNDMKLIFSNSRLYTPNKRSRIYDMTSRLSTSFEETMKKIMSNWRNLRRKRNRRKSRTSEDDSDASTSTSSGEDKSDVSEIDIEADSDTVTPFEQKDSSDYCSSDDSDEKMTRSRRRRSDKATYQPRETRQRSDYKPGTEESSLSSSEEDQDQDYSRKTNLRKRPVRKKAHLYESSSSGDSSDDPNKPVKRLKRTLDSDSSDKSSDYARNNRKENSFISTVSSRGRVRKFTERAKALFRKK
ncbi:bromodomain and WD repeat-containing protein 3 [Diorhabda sublineata]|uniref:bromodomain and WD repeat-containing protein 3 n=2 Tax=Diorhabda sublineata TaxID=1163346 RepID=UPI0024E04998|nr:bromodomain and WD repeat-containing protein 3 [Diorhabda sublineata]